MTSRNKDRAVLVGVFAAALLMILMAATTLGPRYQPGTSCPPCPVEPPPPEVPYLGDQTVEEILDGHEPYRPMDGR